MHGTHIRQNVSQVDHLIRCFRHRFREEIARLDARLDLVHGLVCPFEWAPQLEADRDAHALLKDAKCAVDDEKTSIHGLAHR